MDGGEGCALFIGILVVAAVTIAIVVYVVLPLSVFIFGAISIAGAVSGVGVALYNFQKVFIEAHKTVR